MNRIGRGSVAGLLVLACLGTQATPAGSSFWRLWEQAASAAEAGEYERADKLYTKARRQEPANAYLAYDHAEMLAEAGQVEDAYAALGIAFVKGSKKGKKKLSQYLDRKRAS